MDSLPLILLCNDDGCEAPGLLALREQLEGFATVVVCAPQHNQSACSHSLTLHNVLRLTRHSASTFTLDGTPADCIYVALNTGTRVVPRPPDLVVSGMNRGPNLGVDVLYSGTVAAAREAAYRGVPSLAISTDLKTDVARAAELGGRLVRSAWAELDAARPRRPLLLNVNIPEADSWELQVTRLGHRVYRDRVVFRVDPRDCEYLWLGTAAPEPSSKNEPGTDGHAHSAGYVSVTPLTLDLTAHDHHALASKIVERCG